MATRSNTAESPLGPRNILWLFRFRSRVFFLLPSSFFLLVGPHAPLLGRRAPVALWWRSGGTPVAVRGSGLKSLRLRHLWCRFDLCHFTLRMLLEPGQGEVSPLEAPDRGKTLS